MVISILNGSGYVHIQEWQKQRLELAKTKSHVLRYQLNLPRETPVDLLNTVVDSRCRLSPPGDVYKSQ